MAGPMMAAATASSKLAASGLWPWLPAAARLWRRQLDFVAGWRARRAVATVGHLSRLWGHDRLRDLVRHLAKRLWPRGGNPHCRRRRLMLVGFSFFTSLPTADEDEQQTEAPKSNSWRPLPDRLLENHKRDVELAHKLTYKTLTCSSCGLRLPVESEVSGVHYCHCRQRPASCYGARTEGIPWTPFLERPDILVWRQEHPDGRGGLYVYKMYGRFDDVTPNEFLEVQLDLSSFRMSWDVNSADVRVLDEKLEKEDALSQVYYWEMAWPRFFSNRDYVCNRRSKVYLEENVAVVYSKATDHPDAPSKSNNYRVGEYWSILTLQPLTAGGWNKPGVEFCLTAFENPGLSLPESITTWVAMRGMPEFMRNLRDACISLEKRKDELDTQLSPAIRGLLPKESIKPHGRFPSLFRGGGGGDAGEAGPKEKAHKDSDDKGREDEKEEEAEEASKAADEAAVRPEPKAEPDEEKEPPVKKEFVEKKGDDAEKDISEHDATKEAEEAVTTEDSAKALDSQKQAEATKAETSRAKGGKQKESNQSKGSEESHQAKESEDLASDDVMEEGPNESAGKAEEESDSNSSADQNGLGIGSLFWFK